MNITELCQKLEVLPKNITYDEGGNIYLEYNKCYSNYSELLCCFEDEGTVLDDYSIITADKINDLNCIDIIIPDELLDWYASARRPYYKLRGKKVTPEQAFKIISKMDYVFGFDYKSKDYIDSYILRTYVLNNALDGNIRQDYTWDHNSTWIYPDGTIGCTSMSYKIPNIIDFLVPTFRLVVNFPYLDMVIAITNWDELPYDNKTHKTFSNPTLEQFLGAVEIGIKISNKTITVFDSFDAQSAYREYNKRYPFRKGYINIDEAYIERMFKANNLTEEDTQEFIKKKKKERKFYKIK